MQQQGLDLKGYLEQGRVQAAELLDTMSKLVLEVNASHYWTVHGLETISSLNNICGNVEKLLGACAEHWEEGKAIFGRDEAVKLLKTAVNFYRAIPAVTHKFAEQLAKRRKQRIMGESYDEVAEITPEEMQEALTAFTLRIGEVKQRFTQLSESIAIIPEGLLPDAAQMQAHQAQAIHPASHNA